MSFKNAARKTSKGVENMRIRVNEGPLWCRESSLGP